MESIIHLKVTDKCLQKSTHLVKSFSQDIERVGQITLKFVHLIDIVFGHPLVADIATLHKPKCMYTVSTCKC